MGKNSGHSWLDAVKKAFRSPANGDAEEEEKKRGKKRWSFRRQLSLETTIQHNAAKCANASAVRICSGEENVVRKQPRMEMNQRRALEVVMATAAAAEQAAVEIIRLTRSSVLVKQDQAAVVIQKIFRGYLARRALMALKGVVKLQAVIRGHNVRKRAKITLQCILSLVRVQALVCDQRRRLSCEATTFDSTFSHDNPCQWRSSQSGISSNLDVNPSELPALIKKAKECSLKQGKTTLAHQISEPEQEPSDEQYLTWIREDGNLCHQIKTVEVDYETMFIPNLNVSLLQSPRTPSSSSSKTRSINRTRMSVSDNCRPNYMAATASAIARVTLTTTPRRRLSIPNTEQSQSARKRLSFSDKPNFQRSRGIAQFDCQQRSDRPYYATD